MSQTENSIPQNLEIKARISGIDACCEIAASIHAGFSNELRQRDTYFNVPHGRLKLREIEGVGNELIFYRREESGNQRTSDFEIYPCEDPKRLIELLSGALGIRAVVAKKRLLYMYEDTRIHLDSVSDLGEFIEFEVPVSGDPAKAAATMKFLCASFNIAESSYFKGSYVDLIEQKAASK